MAGLVISRTGVELIPAPANKGGIVSRSLAIAVLIVSLLFSSSVVAAGKKPAPAAVLSQEDLKECVDLEGAASRQIDLYNAQVKAGNALLKKLEGVRAEIEQMRKEIDAGDRSKLDIYNAKIDENNAIVKEHDEYQMRMGEIATEQERITQQFNAKCAGKRFKQSDMYQVKKKGK